MNLKSKLPKRLQKYASFGVLPKLILAPVSFLILSVFLLAKPFVQFRLYRMVDTRIGHLTTNTEIVRLNNLKYNQNGKKKVVIVYCSTSKSVANEFLLKLLLRRMPQLHSHLAWITLFLSQKLRIFNSFSSEGNKNLIVDFTGVLIRNSLKSKLSIDEYNNGKQFLDSIGVSLEKFVCLNVRDSAYISSFNILKHNKHDYRNSKIKDYIAAAETLAEMGYTVFRMGALVEEPLVSNHYRVIDYAKNGMRNEFLDVFLGANCTFCISSGSGWDGIPTIFNRPIGFVNLLPIFSPSSLTLNKTIYPKNFCEQGTSSILTLKKIIEKGIANAGGSGAYVDAGLEIRDLSSEELVEAVTEMAQRVEGTFVETPEQKEMQAKLKHILSTHPKLQPSPNYYPIRAQFASCFLSRYPNFLDGLD